MSRKRPTEASWDSDDDLLQDDISGINAFAKARREDSEDEFDEDALLCSDDEANQTHGNSAFAQGGNFGDNDEDSLQIRVDEEEIRELEEGDDAVTLQEPDDEFAEEEESEYPQEQEQHLMDEGAVEEEEVHDDGDGHDDSYVNTSRNVSEEVEEQEEPEIEESKESESDSESDEEKSERGRFKSERASIVSLSTKPVARTSIPDTLEISEEEEKKIERFFSENKRGRRGGRGGRGRGSQYQQRGMGQRSQPYQQGPQRSHQGQYQSAPRGPFDRGLLGQAPAQPLFQHMGLGAGPLRPLFPGLMSQPGTQLLSGSLMLQPLHPQRLQGTQMFGNQGPPRMGLQHGERMLRPVPSLMDDRGQNRSHMNHDRNDHQGPPMHLRNQPPPTAPNQDRGQPFQGPPQGRQGMPPPLQQPMPQQRPPPHHHQQPPPHQQQQLPPHQQQHPPPHHQQPPPHHQAPPVHQQPPPHLQQAPMHQQPLVRQGPPPQQPSPLQQVPPHQPLPRPQAGPPFHPPPQPHHQPAPHQPQQQQPPPFSPGPQHHGQLPQPPPLMALSTPQPPNFPRAPNSSMAVTTTLRGSSPRKILINPHFKGRMQAPAQAHTQVSWSTPGLGGNLPPQPPPHSMPSVGGGYSTVSQPPHPGQYPHNMGGSQGPPAFQGQGGAPPHQGGPGAYPPPVSHGPPFSPPQQQQQPPFQPRGQSDFPPRSRGPSPQYPGGPPGPGYQQQQPPQHHQHQPYGGGNQNHFSGPAESGDSSFSRQSRYSPMKQPQQSPQNRYHQGQRLGKPPFQQPKPKVKTNQNIRVLTGDNADVPAPPRKRPSGSEDYGSPPKMARTVLKKEEPMDEEMKTLQKKLEEQKQMRERIIREKERKRQLLAEQKRRELAQRLGKPMEEGTEKSQNATAPNAGATPKKNSLSSTAQQKLVNAKRQLNKNQRQQQQQQPQQQQQQQQHQQQQPQQQQYQQQQYQQQQRQQQQQQRHQEQAGQPIQSLVSRSAQPFKFQRHTPPDNVGAFQRQNSGNQPVLEEDQQPIQTITRQVVPMARRNSGGLLTQPARTSTPQSPVARGRGSFRGRGGQGHMVDQGQSGQPFRGGGMGRGGGAMGRGRGGGQGQHYGGQEGLMAPEHFSPGTEQYGSQAGARQRTVISLSPAQGPVPNQAKVFDRLGPLGSKGQGGRVVLKSASPKANSSRFVSIDGLSASTGEEAITRLCNTVGPTETVTLQRSQRKAIVKFASPTHALNFAQRYQRYMLDLSHITVSLLPG